MRHMSELDKTVSPTPPFIPPIVRRMKLIREWKGMTKAAFARAIDISPNYYGMFENGERAISHDLAKKIKAAFSVPLDYLYDGDMSDQMPSGLLKHLSLKK